MKYPQNEKYKDSGIKWLGQIPEDWDIWKVSHGFSLIGSGTTPNTEDLELYGNEIPWITTSELRENVIEDAIKSISKKAFNEISTLKLYPKGTLLIAMYGATIGRMGLLGIEATVNQACCALSYPKIFHTKFVFYWIYMARPVIISLSSGGGQPNLNQDLIKKLKIPIPNLQEQQSIANFLDKETTRLDALIAKKQQLIEILKEKRIAIISHAVTKGLNADVPLKDTGIEWLGEVPEHWEVKKLKFTVKLINQKVEKVDDTDESNTKYVGLENVIPFKGQITFNGDSYIPEGISNSFKIGDVLFGKLRPYLAKAFVADINGICSSELLVFRPISILSNEFLLLLILSDGFLKLVNSSTYGSKMPRASWDFIGNIPITLPKIDEQLEIVQKTMEELFLIDSILTKTEEAINKLLEYKTALISAAVTGKIKVPELA